MDFNFKGFFRFMHLWLSNGRWTTRRVAIFIAFCLGFPLLELTIWLSFLFDNIFFRGYRREDVDSPVFIIGNPRSGTTFLHRLMARDEEHFSTMLMWEILFAPSITLRKIIMALANTSTRLGILPHKRLDSLEKRWHEQVVMHNISLLEPEEDDYLLLHIWSALTIGLSAGLLKEAMPYTYFDEALPKEERKRIMAFYKRCIQRHLHARRSRNGTETRRYLAKNPALSPKLDTLFEAFPGAKIIYLVRNPLDMIPSYLSMMNFSWQVLGIPVEDHELRDYILEMARHWYRYPMERLEKSPEGSYMIVKYDDLVRDPEHIVREIYSRFGFEMDASFSRVLREESARARRFNSRHLYALEEMGLSRRQIVTEYRDVFDQFGFETSSEANAPPAMNRPTGTKRSGSNRKSRPRPKADRILGGEQP